MSMYKNIRVKRDVGLYGYSCQHTALKRDAGLYGYSCQHNALKRDAGLYGYSCQHTALKPNLSNTQLKLSYWFSRMFDGV